MEHPKNMMNRLLSEILPKAAALRRELHRYPETAYRETETRKRLLQWFEQEGVLGQFTVREPLTGTDLVLEMQGSEEGFIGLRADMDALPIEEQTDAEYASEHPGMMHACGHDGHMAILAGAAAAAAKYTYPLPSLRFIFQPGEEEVAAGAELVSAGVCTGLDRIYALHGWPGIPLGAVAVKEGVMLAAAGTFVLTCRGKSSHGAAPEKGKNPLFAAAEIVLELEELHRRVSDAYQAVVSPCSVQGGESSNGIPETAVIKGTTRYLDDQTGAYLKQALEDTVNRCSTRWEIPVDIEYHARYWIPVVNDKEETERVISVAEALFGRDHIIRLEHHEMVAEDFAFYLKQVPGCFFFLGMGKGYQGLHTAQFNFNDELLLPGMQMMMNLLIPESNLP